MSRGLGTLQRAIVDAATEPVTIAELAEVTGASPSSVRNAVAALRRRGLVTTRTARVRWDGASLRAVKSGRVGIRFAYRENGGPSTFQRAVPGLVVESVQPRSPG